jgi:hypothetical protein
MVFSAMFNNISIISSSWSVLLLDETGEDHRPTARHWQTVSPFLMCFYIIYLQFWTAGAINMAFYILPNVDLGKRYSVELLISIV